MKTWKKRLPALLLALVMCLSLLPGVALADEGDFTIEDGVLKKYSGGGGQVVIPDGVTAIGDRVFNQKTDVTGVTIPSGVTSIGRGAFYGCTGLTSIEIPSSVTTIGDYAFQSCTGLRSVNIPYGVTSIGKYALMGCPSLTSVDIPDSVTTIGEHAFAEGGLTSIVIPDSVTSMGGYMFFRCTSLKSAVIGRGASDPFREPQFINCQSLTSITVNSRVSNIDYNSFNLCRNLTEIRYSGTTEEWQNALAAGMQDKTVSYIGPNGFNTITPYTAMKEIPQATVYCSNGNISGSSGTGSNPGTAANPGTTTDPGAQSGALTIRRGPDSDSVDLSDMDYPARFYCYPTLVVDGVEVPESSYHITYSWSLIGLGARPTNNSTSDKYNCCTIQSPYSTVSNLRLTCHAVAEYNGASYTADVAWNNIYRSSDYKGSSSNTNNRQVVVTFDSQGGTPVDSITVTTGQTYGPLPTTTRPGYEFWYWETRSHVSIWPNSTVPPSSNGKQTLYARWNKLKEDSGTTTNPGTTTPTDPGTTTPTDPTTPKPQETTDSLAQAAASAFNDVSKGDYFDAPVGWALKNQITNGTSPTQFSPDENCTQTQILTFLYRAARGGGAASAEDMTHAVNWARDKGMIGASFDANAPCTRATAVTYIWNVFGNPTESAGSFSDVDANSAYAAAVSWAVKQGITKGTSDTTFSPDKVCNRGEIATFLYRAYN